MRVKLISRAVSSRNVCSRARRRDVAREVVERKNANVVIVVHLSEFNEFFFDNREIFAVTHSFRRRNA